MKHNIKMFGYNYKLRPIELEDAQFILDVRLENENKSKYLHKISNDVSAQEKWLNNYFTVEDDYYFVIENLFTKEKEGLIGIYNVDGEKAEWGRWVLKSGSLASFESVMLICNIAFEKLGLKEVYTKTISENTQVTAFHKNIGAKLRRIITDGIETDNKKYDITEQYIDKEMYESEIKKGLEQKCQKLFERNVRSCTGGFKLHHLGIATDNIDDAYNTFYKDYSKGDYFEDKQQGVAGLFISHQNKPTLELLENLPESHTLDFFLKNGIQLYHTGYLTDNYSETYDFFINNLGAKIISDTKISEYFKGRICFVMLKNKKITEFIEAV